jgi:lysophospholipase L1-like esterase/dienelactone hydrolase
MMTGFIGDLKKFNEAVAPIVTMAIADTKAAMAYVRQHAADYNIKTDKIGIIGFSAGGTLAESMAFDYTPETKPDFTAPIYAYVPEGQSMEVPADAPPMFIAAATDDQLHLVPSSQLLYNKWMAAGKSVEMHLYAHGGHGFGMRRQNIPTDSWIDRLGDWMQQLGFITPPKIPQQDWPFIARFAADNAKVSPPAASENRVVFMGNSITEGWIRTDPAYFSSHPYINRGISGQTTPQMLLRFRPDVINLKPKVVVILAGTNDIAGNTGPETLETIMGNLTSMAELAKAHGIKVVLSSVLPAFDFGWRPGLHPADKIVALNAMIKDYAAKNGCVYLDYWTAMADDRKGLPANLSHDGVHPTVDGYKIMEPLAEKAIAQAMTHK